MVDMTSRGVPAATPASASPLLMASAFLAMASTGWVCFLLFEYCPWLAKLIFIATVTIALFAGSAVCFLLYVLQVFQLLNCSIFELLHSANVTVMLPIYNWMRVALLVFAALEEKDREQIVRELDGDFRRTVFQRPIFEFLPPFLQCGFVKHARTSKQETPSHNDRGIAVLAHVAKVQQDESRLDGSSTMLSCERGVDVPPAAAASCIDEGASSPTLTRRRSVSDVLQLIRDAEGATRETMDSSVLQRVLAEKFVDQAAAVIRQGATHQYDTQMGTTVHDTVEAIKTLREKVTTPPNRILLRVPWEMARISLGITTSAWGYLLASTPQEQQEREEPGPNDQGQEKKKN
eukprot:TRINITY_DN33170_c0_g1_i1.p1 TRINITY_DN33170_c0_g1~~TRINITY_DN33170_c0_g1_i1.p1  ORF type:complete len:348 (+),score=72.46 TRINITY_DN33170_c0_g1_i1:181-1224(+)